MIRLNLTILLNVHIAATLWEFKNLWYFFFNSRAESMAVISVLFLVPLNSTRVELEKKEKKEKCLSVDESKKNIMHCFVWERTLGKRANKITISFFFIMLSVSLFAVCLSTMVAFRAASPPPPPPLKVLAGERKREGAGEGGSGFKFQPSWA